MYLQGILFEKTTRQADYMAITAVLSVNDQKASQLMSGALKVFLSERVQGRGGNAETSAPQGRKRKKQKSKSNAGASRDHDDHAHINDNDVIEEPVADAIENTSSHEQVMLVMLQQLNNAFRERLGGKRAVFNTAVQRSLALDAPRTMKELDEITVSGVSVPMKKKYGKYLIQAVGQVDAFVEKHSSHLDTMVDSFELDVDAILGPRIMTAREIQTQPTPGKEGGLDWGESDDDWEIMPSENAENDDGGGWNHVSRTHEY